MQNLQDSCFMLKRYRLKFFNLQDFIFKAWCTLCFNSVLTIKHENYKLKCWFVHTIFNYDLKMKHFMFKN